MSLVRGAEQDSAPYMRIPEAKNFKDLTDTVTKTRSANLRRLHLSLVPRLPRLEMLGVAAALVRAQEAMASREADGKTWSATCDHVRTYPQTGERVMTRRLTTCCNDARVAAPSGACAPERKELL